MAGLSDGCQPVIGLNVPKCQPMIGLNVSLLSRQRVEEEKADWLVYLTDAGQSLHFQCVFACAKKAGEHFKGTVTQAVLWIQIH